MSSPFQTRLHTPFYRVKAFTLVELLVVMAIIGLIISISVPLLKGMLEANSIAGASQCVVDQISRGRQMAAARNVSIEVRFVLQPARLLGSAASFPGVYNAVQLWRIDPAGGASQPVSKLEPLPNDVVVAVGTAAPYLSPPLVSTATPPPLSGTQDFGGTPLSYVGFEIRPTGLVPAMLDQGLGNTFVTIVALRYSSSSANDLSGATRKVSNYAIVQFNPYTGSTKTYQP